VRGRDGNYSPFNVESTTSFDALRILIGEKLNCFPGTLQLVYRINNNKQSMSIRTEEELEIFMTQMRGQIVPPATKNGQPSTRAIKAVTVYFEDAGEATAKESSAASSKNSAKQASPLLSTPALY
jgi:hypothetical protein